MDIMDLAQHPEKYGVTVPNVIVPPDGGIHLGDLPALDFTRWKLYQLPGRVFLVPLEPATQASDPYFPTKDALQQLALEKRWMVHNAPIIVRENAWVSALLVEMAGDQSAITLPYSLVGNEFWAEQRALWSARHNHHMKI